MIAPDISIIIPTFMRDESLVNTIESVLRQDFPCFELIVVDQTINSGPKLKRALSACSDPRLRYFQIAPPSLPAARNFGLEKANGKVIVFIDDDVILFPDFLKTHWEAYADASISGVGGRVIHKEHPLSEYLCRIGFDGMDSGFFNCIRDQDCSVLPGCNMSFRGEALQSVGMFDTRFYENAHREESDICSRLVKGGHRLVFRAAAVLSHSQEPKGGCRASSEVYWNTPAYFHNDTLYFLKHRNWLCFPIFFLKMFKKHVLYARFLIGRYSALWLVMLLSGVTGGFWSYCFGKQFRAKEVAAGGQLGDRTLAASPASS